MTTKEDIQFLLNDTRNCKSNNLQKFFRTHKGRRLVKHLGMEIIRTTKGELWFATLGWLVQPGIETGYAGVMVREVACWGAKSSTGYPVQQTGSDYEVVTDWFWEKYRERGVVAIPEIWNIKIPPQIKHAEAHYL